ncbi:TPA: DUF4398 domain-containing protein [Candidatus Poribacteria bacterium]|nr:DUF4398 domain-containing protein [Candidatus Poribacteria bacterium]
MHYSEINLGFSEPRNLVVKLFCRVIIACYVFIAYVGCGVSVDPIELENNIINAQNAINQAENLDAAKFARERLNRARDFLDQARQARDTNQSVQSIDLAFRGQMQAQLAEAYAREQRAKQKIDQVYQADLRAMVLGMEYEIQIAETGKMIAEERAHQAEVRETQAEERANQAEAEAIQSRRESTAAIATARVQTQIDQAQSVLDTAKDLGALAYALTDYQTAEKQLNQSVFFLSQGQLDQASEIAVQAEQTARIARTMAINGLTDAQASQSQAYAKANFVVSYAREEIRKAERVNAFIHAKDLITKAKRLSEQANNAMRLENYDHAIDYANQSKEQANQAYVISNTAEKLRLEQEALEEKIAQAKDMIFKAEETFNQDIDLAINLDPNGYNKSKLLLDQAQKALKSNNYDKAIENAQKSINQLKLSIKNAQRLDTLETQIVQAVKQIKKIGSVEINRNPNGVLIRFSKDVFESGSAKLNQKYFSIIKQLGRIIEEFSNLKIRVESHSDSIGDAVENKKLTERRVNVFMKYLLKESNLSKDNLTAVGLGEKNPIATNINKTGRDKNRRIDVIFLTRTSPPIRNKDL